MMSSLSVTPARGYADLRSNIYEVEEHIREADSLKGEKVPDEIKNVALMKIMFEDLRLYVRRQGLHTDKHTYKELRSCFTEQAAMKDEERAASGSAKQLEGGKGEAPYEQGHWMEGVCGTSVWVAT